MIYTSHLRYPAIWNRRLAAPIAVFILFALNAGAQDPQRNVTPKREPLASSVSEQSDLGKDNLNHVAASPALLKEILTGDQGLLVELKRLVAQEATDNGQL